MALKVPSNKTLILGAVCLSLVAAIAAFKIGEAKRMSLRANMSRESAVFIDLQKTNEEGQLLQAALRNLDVQAAIGTSSDENPFSPSVNDTLTDSLAKNLFLTYAQIQNGNDARTDEEIASGIVGQIDTAALPKAVFSLSNVKIVSPRTAEDIKTYGNRVGAIIKDNYTYIADRKDTIKLAEIAQIHKKIGTEMIAIPAPTAIAQMHLAMANDYALLGASFEIISSQEKKDPLKSLLAIRTAKDSAENLDQVYKEINSYFAKNAILFTNEEPGVVWSRIVLQ